MKISELIKLLETRKKQFVIVFQKVNLKKKNYSV